MVNDLGHHGKTLMLLKKSSKKVQQGFKRKIKTTIVTHTPTELISMLSTLQDKDTFEKDRPTVRQSVQPSIEG